MIDATEFKNEVIRLATEQPDRTASCQYLQWAADSEGVIQSVPNCIMGHALFNLGVSTEDLDRMENVNIRGVNGDLHLGLPGDLVDWAQRVQGRQDDGDTWGGALKYANEVAA